MVPFLRVVSIGALIYGVYAMARNSGQETRGGDLTQAFWFAYCVVVGLVAALLWAPALADRLIGSPTGRALDPTFTDPPGRLLRVIRRLNDRKFRRWTRWLCFVEGVRHPWRPAPFVIGMDNSEPGSWLEAIYAREVYRFTNVENCVRAFHVLRRHGRTPAPHPRAEVNRVVSATEDATPPKDAPPPVPDSLPATSPRNRRIALPSDTDRPGTPPNPRSGSSGNPS